VGKEKMFWKSSF